MQTETKYCVVAESRSDKKRRAITGPMSKSDAVQMKEVLNKSAKSIYRYFRVAKHPYRSRS